MAAWVQLYQSIPYILDEDRKVKFAVIDLTPGNRLALDKDPRASWSSSTFVHFINNNCNALILTSLHSAHHPCLVALCQ
jgi:hypothetical protein